jgi:hypothetical protein
MLMGAGALAVIAVVGGLFMLRVPHKILGRDHAPLHTTEEERVSVPTVDNRPVQENDLEIESTDPPADSPTGGRRFYAPRRVPATKATSRPTFLHSPD